MKVYCNECGKVISGKSKMYYYDNETDKRYCKKKCLKKAILREMELAINDRFLEIK